MKLDEKNAGEPVVPRRRRAYHPFVALGLVVYLVYALVLKQAVFAGLSENADYKQLFFQALEINLAANWSKIYTSEPHLAGTNLGLVNFTKEKFEQYGLEASVDVYEVLLSYPLDHALNLVDSKSGKVVYSASLEEDEIDEDETTKGDDRIPTFLGYAANGNVTAEYVYVNYGTVSDFAKLHELGVSVNGKIVVARYGKIFRGLKVKFAQDHGAVGVLLYSDPGDDFGLTPANGVDQYPKGPARQESSVQRGSVQFLGGEGAYPGDPTTPGYASKPGTIRKDPYKAIGQIPALAVSYREVKPILKALNGHGTKVEDKNWVGEVEGFKYFTGPAKHTELNLYNHQNFTIAPIHNVYGEIEGEAKDEVILIGNHRDAWIKGGAGDPNSGSAVLIELARAFGALKDAGYKFKRTIILQSWDGEEYGLLGSTEFGEYASKLLQKKVVAYLNVDVAVSSKNLDLGASPALFSILKKVAAEVEYPEEDGGSLLDHYNGRTGGEIAALGSGSDYTVFLEHLGIPSADIGFGSGGKNSPIYHYHSNYDSYHWMEKFGDPGFVYHNTIAKYLGLVALELNEKALIDFKLSDYSVALLKYFHKAIEKVPKDWYNQTSSERPGPQSLFTAAFISDITDGHYGNTKLPVFAMKCHHHDDRLSKRHGHDEDFEEQHGEFKKHHGKFKEHHKEFKEHHKGLKEHHKEFMEHHKEFMEEFKEHHGDFKKHHGDFKKHHGDSKKHHGDSKEHDELKEHHSELQFDSKKHSDGHKGKHGSKHPVEGPSLRELINATHVELNRLRETTEIFDQESESLQTQWDNRDSLYFWQRIKLHFQIKKHNKLAQYFERNFLYPKGLHKRTWFKHIVFASGRFTGYAGQVFPILQEPIEDGDFDRLAKGLKIVSDAFKRISDHLVV